ncbi:MAG: hypothetical protein LBJ00_05815 [Planctomycetaceae bacterium]|jgi:hypothetical protein|nr:hypothetical protein [Planctomycetaceae bacterium]
MIKIIYQSIFLIFCFFVFLAGCERVYPPAEPSREERQAHAERILNSYVEDVQREVAAKPIEIDVVKEIEEIEREPEKQHNLRFSILVRQLLVAKQISEAENVVDKINNSAIRDTCLSEIAHRQVTDFKKSVAVTQTPTEPNSVTEPMASELRKIVEVIDKIDDPILFVGLSIELATAAFEKSDEQIAVDMLVKAVEKVRNSKAEIVRRVKSLQMITGWFLERKQKNRALEICTETEKIAVLIVHPIDGISAMLDLSRFYMAIGSIADANRVFDASIPFIAKITNPAERATAILRIADMLPMLLIGFKDKGDVSKLAQLKELILSVDPIIAKHGLAAKKDIASNDLNSGKTEINNINSVSSLAEHFDFVVLSWGQIRERRDVLLCNLVRHQVWFVVEARISLDEIWSTIHDIDDNDLRDNAIIAAVNILSFMGSFDEAKDWADFISNVEKKKDTIKKVETKSQESKANINTDIDSNVD